MKAPIYHYYTWYIMNQQQTKNSVSLLASNIIFVQKIGDQTEASMRALWDEVEKYAKQLRSQGKSVLILSDASREGMMDIGARNISAIIGSQLDYDKSASYNAAKRLRAVRDMMTHIERLDGKVGNFATREEAIAWLLK